MAQQANVFVRDFDHVRESLTNLTHYQFVVTWRLKEANKSAERSLKVAAKRGYRDKFGGGNALTITDVFHQGSWVHRAPGGARITAGQSIVPMTREMEGRFNSYMLVAAYERFESLLKDFFGRLLYQMRSQIALSLKKRFHLEKPKMVKIEGTLPYYQAYARHFCRRDCNEAIKVFKKVLPMQTITYMWSHGLAFEEVYKCLEFCRHCIVHSEGRWPASAKPAFNTKQQKFISSHMRKSMLTGEQTILLTGKQTDFVTEMLVSYAYGLLVLLSEKFNMKISNPYFQR